MTTRENVTITRDVDGHWYWIPNDLINEFERHNNRLRGLDYIDAPDDYDDFIAKYEHFRTGGSPDIKPEYYE